MADKKSDLAISMVTMLVLGAGLCVGAYFMLRGAWSVMDEAEGVGAKAAAERMSGLIGVLGAAGLLLGLGGVALVGLAGKCAWMIARGNREDEQEG
ncbi:MAG: hypothetical protein DYG92_04875 [Leptolyngbya sp. PLA1]|nr:hypothetical protein [Leptolyngbya sp. PLA1]